MKLCFINFWDGAFDGDFFNFFFRSCFPDLVYTDNQYDADLVVSSVFGHTQSDPSKTIAYIGENVRPSYIGYNYSLSFDWDSYGGRNHRLPLWYARLAWPGFEQKPRRPNMHNHGYEQLIDIESLTKPRKLNLEQKTKFCALIANNPEGLRINLYNTISQYKQVDGYGNMFNRPLRQSKLDILPQYRFCLCPENSVYDGYVTEKLIDAYAGGAIPIYSGATAVDWEFNAHAFLNYYDMTDMNWFIKHIKKIDSDDEEYVTMYEQPLLENKPTLESAIAFVRSIVN